METTKMKWEEDLVKDIRLHDERDDFDYPLGNNKQSFVFYNVLPDFPRWQSVHDFSKHNQNSLREYFVEKAKNAKCVVEIGVSRDSNKEETSTNILLRNKPKDCVYLGVDLQPKTYLDNDAENVHTIVANSSDTETVMQKLNSLGVEEIDFLMIDGWHSINQVLDDWEYTKWLSKDGVVAFHDTAYHPGPYLFINNLDTEKWEVVPNTCKEHIFDFGIGFAWRK